MPPPQGKEVGLTDPSSANHPEPSPLHAVTCTTGSHARDLAWWVQ
jgi:hypothetical protein